MQFHQLKYFVAAAEELGFSKAAEKVRISQPALSRQIALLEEELGAPLFRRNKQRVTLTPAGRFFLPRARQILCDAELAGQQVSERFGGGRRTLRLGFIGPFLDDLVAPAVRRFAKARPGATVSLFDLPPKAQLDRLREGELDAAVLSNLDDQDRRRFRVRPLLRTSGWAAVLPESHPLAGRKSLRLAELSAMRWVSLSDAMFPGRRAFFDDCCARAGFRPRAVEEADSLPLMFVRIADQDCAGIAPLHAAKIAHAGCVFIPLAAPVITTHLLLVLPKKPGNPTLETLADALGQQAVQMEKTLNPRDS